MQSEKAITILASIMKYFALFLSTLIYLTSYTQNWIDTLDAYARVKYLPAKRYTWTWQHAALLNSMIKQYDLGKCEADRVNYLKYVEAAMNKTWKRASGKTPNGVASAMGLAFMYRVTKDEKYKAKAEKVYADYMKIRRTNNGAVSHLMGFTELWDDTIFMIGQFLLGMYQATGDEKYLDELMLQIRQHRDKLRTENGLWVHGWDDDNKQHCMFCSQYNWADKQTRKSPEAWGRGNGWVVVTLADVVQALPKENKYHAEVAGYLKEMIAPLPALQDSATGHWYQLPLRKAEEGNYLESSCTAMFGYGIATALHTGLVSGKEYKDAVDRAYTGLREYSLVPKGRFLTTANVCTGTCIGYEQYYFKRAKQQGRTFGIGPFIFFGRKYENTCAKK